MNPAPIVIIGTGRAATALGGRWSLMHEVMWWSRRDGPIEDAPSGDVIVLAVPDAVIVEVAARLATRGWAPSEVWLHLSGVHAAGVLRVDRAAYRPKAVGCLHPLVALAPGADPTGAIAGIEGEAEAVVIAERLAREIGLVPHPIPAERALYHAAAVSVAGHATALFAQAMSLMQTAGFSRDAARDALRPLMASAVENLARGAPEAVITGPVSRGDLATVKRHLDALAAHGDPDLLLAYQVLARAAVRLSAESIGPEAVARLSALLG